jgi:hypothetical protein
MQVKGLISWVLRGSAGEEIEGTTLWLEMPAYL